MIGGGVGPTGHGYRAVACVVVRAVALVPGTVLGRELGIPKLLVDERKVVVRREVFGVERIGSRHAVHPPEFVAIEQTYPDYARCKAWEEQHLPRLLRFRPTRGQTPGRFGARA